MPEHGWQSGKVLGLQSWPLKLVALEADSTKDIEDKSWSRSSSSTLNVKASHYKIRILFDEN